MDLIIREIIEIDLPNIPMLYSQPEMDNGKVLSVEDAKTIFKKIQKYPDYKVYIAELDNKAVGTFALLIMDNLAHNGTPSGVVEDVAVHEQHHGKGIGKQMMQYAMKKCRVAGCYKLVLSSNMKRKNAHEFYESLGFKQHGISFTIDF